MLSQKEKNSFPTNPFINEQKTALSGQLCGPNTIAKF